MADTKLPSLLERHWAESALAIGAVVIAAVSLWVGYDTMRTNRRLVAATSWPFVQVLESDSQGPPRSLALRLSNSGIGPAKVEFFQVLWKGQPQRSATELLRNCCQIAQLPNHFHGASDQGLVLRAGQRQTFLHFAAGRANLAQWKAFHSLFFLNAGKLSVRYCYCSAFNQCWLVTETTGQAIDLNPPRVPICPEPKVTFNVVKFKHG